MLLLLIIYTFLHFIYKDKPNRYVLLKITELLSDIISYDILVVLYY